jgi:hypothetical protein
MNARKLGALCALLAATPNLIGCESSRLKPNRVSGIPGDSKDNLDRKSYDGKRRHCVRLAVF